MLSKKMLDELNKQVNAELYSSYLYLSMAAYFESINLKGFANWMKIQAQEEVTHAMKFFDYINERGGRVTLDTIKKPPAEWKSPLDVFENTYKHEVNVTKMINSLVDLAIKEKDHATYNMLQWFVAEQVEEEASADAIRQQLKFIGKDGRGLLMLDRELSRRVFTPPAQEEK
ncbi:MAG: ferritin [Thermoplasmata archaeon]|nr:MAG: ferritin [Thermoplasmata archaeon]